MKAKGALKEVPIPIVLSGSPAYRQARLIGEAAKFRGSQIPPLKWTKMGEDVCDQGLGGRKSQKESLWVPEG